MLSRYVTSGSYRLLTESDEMVSGVQLARLAVTGEQLPENGQHDATVTFSVVGQTAHRRPVVQAAFVVHRRLQDLLSLHPCTGCYEFTRTPTHTDLTATFHVNLD